MQVANDYYSIELDPRNGVIRRIADKIGHIELITEQRLAENFRILLPIPGLHSNYIVGAEQKLTSLDRTSGGVVLHWAGPMANEHGEFDIAMTMWIELAGEAVRFRCEVQNRTDHDLAEVWYPVLGGMSGLGNDTQRPGTKVLVPHGTTQWTRDLFREFGLVGESLGCLGAEHAFFYPGRMSMPWCSFYHPALNRGLYFASHDPQARARALRLAMAPGVATGRLEGDWPTAGELGGLPAGVTMNWAWFPYLKPGGTFEGPPVVLQCHEGDWRRSAALYRDWFTSAFPLVDSRTHWLRRSTEFMDTMFMLPEDNINYSYADIPQWARTAADCGLKSVLISGWQVGGHDRGYPCYEPEPRLGTWAELEAGVRACHEMDLCVYFFANVQTVDITSEWYRRELHQYIIMDPWGNPCFVRGWGMGTLGARMEMTRVNTTDMNPAHPRVREIIVSQMRHLAEIGADGVHLDKLFGYPLDFNPCVEGRPDRAMHEGILKCVEEILSACREINPAFCLSYENNWDRLMSYSDVCWWGSQLSPMKEVFPQWTAITGLTQPWAFNTVNAAVLSGGHLMVGPGHYMRAMDYEPMRALCNYVAEIARIRGELHDILSRGRVLGASVEPYTTPTPALRLEGDFASDPHAQWTVFQDVRTGQRAAVLANMGRRDLIASAITFNEAPGKACRVYEPFTESRAEPLPVTLTVAPERVAIIVE